MAKNKKDQTKTKSNPILWFLFAIVVPLVVAVTIIIIIFTVAGFNVIDWAKNTGNNIPVISSVVATDKEKSNQRTEETNKDTIAKKDEKIDELEANVTDLESTVDQLKQDIIKFKNANETITNKQESDEKSAKKDKNSQLTSMTASFEEMDPKQTALILQDLDEGMAVKILKGLPEEVRAGVLEEMETEKAAQYTKAYLNSSE